MIRINKLSAASQPVRRWFSAGAASPAAGAAAPPEVSVAQVSKSASRTGMNSPAGFRRWKPSRSAAGIGIHRQGRVHRGSLVKRGDTVVRHRSAALPGRIRSRGGGLKALQDGPRIGANRVGPRAALKDSGAVSEEEPDERKSTVAQAEANVAGAASRSRSGLAQFELYPGDQPDRRARQPRGSDPRQSGHRRKQRRHVAVIGRIDGSDLYCISMPMSKAICATCRWRAPASAQVRATTAIQCKSDSPTRRDFRTQAASISSTIN